MTISDLTSRDVVTVPPDTALMEIRQHLHEEEYHHLLVVDNGTLLGVISDRDMLEALSRFLDTYSDKQRDVQTPDRLAHEIMRADPITAALDTDIREAARRLLDYDISSLPVVEGAELIGIVTTEDLLHHYANGHSAET